VSSQRLQQFSEPAVLVVLLLLSAATVSPRGLFLCALPCFGWMLWRLARSRWPGTLGGAAVLLLLPGIYFFNASHQWKEGGGTLPVSHLPFLPASAFPEGGLVSWGFLLVGLTVFWLSAALNHKQAEWMGLILSAAGAVTALAVIGQRLSPRPYPVYEQTGFFRYENHFAAFANCILPVALCRGVQLRRHFLRAGRLSSPAGLLWLSSALLVIACILSGSRAGILICGLILTAFAGVMADDYFRRKLRIRWSRRRTRMILWCSLLFVAMCGAILAVFKWDGLAIRGKELSFRAQVLSDTASMWRDNPLWGTGPGSFAAIFPYYQTVPPEQTAFLHAHCDPLEFLAEWGLAGIALFLAAGGIMIRDLLTETASERHTGRFSGIECAGLCLALTAVGLHSLIDFPFRHPLIALMALMWLGMLVRECSFFNIRSAGR